MAEKRCERFTTSRAGASVRCTCGWEAHADDPSAAGALWTRHVAAKSKHQRVPVPDNSGGDR